MADTTDSGSPWAVAYQLMTKIAHEEAGRNVMAERNRDPRAYFLQLYAECLQAVAKLGPPAT